MHWVTQKRGETVGNSMFQEIVAILCKGLFTNLDKSARKPKSASRRQISLTIFNFDFMYFLSHYILFIFQNNIFVPCVIKINRPKNES